MDPSAQDGTGARAAGAYRARLRPRRIGDAKIERFHGEFAPNSQHRALVSPSKRGKGNKARVPDEPPTPAECRAAMTWAQRLKRVFGIDMETSPACDGAVKVIACIEDPVVIKRILDHLKQKAEPNEPSSLPESRAPPTILFA
jgi:hypothetical protein